VPESLPDGLLLRVITKLLSRQCGTCEAAPCGEVASIPNGSPFNLGAKLA